MYLPVVGLVGLFIFFQETNLPKYLFMIFHIHFTTRHFGNEGMFMTEGVRIERMDQFMPLILVNLNDPFTGVSIHIQEP